MSNNENQDKQHKGGQKSDLVTFGGKVACGDPAHGIRGVH